MRRDVSYKSLIISVLVSTNQQLEPKGFIDLYSEWMDLLESLNTGNFHRRLDSVLCMSY